ncbi:hypothetical protein ACLOJK_027724 [Asimina triloba]
MRREIFGSFSLYFPTALLNRARQRHVAAGPNSPETREGAVQESCGKAQRATLAGILQGEKQQLHQEATATDLLPFVYRRKRKKRR